MAESPESRYSLDDILLHQSGRVAELIDTAVKDEYEPKASWLLIRSQSTQVDDLHSDSWLATVFVFSFMNGLSDYFEGFANFLRICDDVHR